MQIFTGDDRKLGTRVGFVVKSLFNINKLLQQDAGHNNLLDVYAKVVNARFSRFAQEWDVREADAKSFPKLTSHFEQLESASGALSKVEKLIHYVSKNWTT